MQHVTNRAKPVPVMTDKNSRRFRAETYHVHVHPIGLVFTARGRAVNKDGTLSKTGEIRTTEVSVDDIPDYAREQWAKEWRGVAKSAAQYAEELEPDATPPKFDNVVDADTWMRNRRSQ